MSTIANDTQQKAQIFVDGRLAGVLINSGQDWQFQYLPSYQDKEHPVSLLLPVVPTVYHSKKLFSYFEGLFVEGWQKAQLEKAFGPQTLMETLLYRCAHSVGDVQIGPWGRDQPPSEKFASLPTAQPKLDSPPELCLYCLKKIEPLTGYEYHRECSKTFFGQEIPPQFNFAKEDLPQISLKSLSSGITIPGVQQKVSMAYGFNHYSYIIKPQVQGVKEIPELENLWMSFAEVLGLIPALHGLCRLKDHSLAYITLRFDRTPEGRIHVEDFSQLMEKTTYENDKYESSYLDVAKALERWLIYRLKDQKTRFFEWILFNFIFGNNDAHLKNLALLRIPAPGKKNLINVLAPVYDLVPTAFVEEKSRQPELALPLMPGGKVRNFNRDDFLSFAKEIGIKKNAVDHFIDKLKARKPEIQELAGHSLLSAGKRLAMQKKINKRLRALSYPDIKLELAEASFD